MSDYERVEAWMKVANARLDAARAKAREAREKNLLKDFEEAEEESAMQSHISYLLRSELAEMKKPAHRHEMWIKGPCSRK